MPHTAAKNEMKIYNPLNKRTFIFSRVMQLVLAVVAVMFMFSCTTVETSENGKVTKKNISILGYDLGPPKRNDGIYKIYIPRIGNQDREPHLQMEVTNLIIDQFTKEQSYYVVPRAKEADGILNVVITKILMSPVRYVDKSQSKQAQGVPVEFRVVVYANIEMLKAKTKKKVWSLNRVTGKYTFNSTREYPFQEAKREAIIQACSDLSREIVDNSVERWE